MLKKVCYTIIASGILFFTNPAYSAEFQTMGFKAVSMGGAGVATSRGSFATYYNPALLSYHKHGCEISLSAGAGFREINLADHIDTLSEIDIDQTFTEMEELLATGLDSSAVLAAIAGDGTLAIDSTALQSDVTIIKRELRAISIVNGLQLMPNISLGVQLGNFGFGLYNMGEATAFATIDSDRLDFIISQEVTGYGTAYIKYDETVGSGGVFSVSNEVDFNANSLQTAISPTTGDSSTYLTLSGIVYSELPVAYGHNFKIPSGNLAIGGAIKMIQGTTYGAKIDIDSETDNLEDELKDSEEDEMTMGVDLGLLYRPTCFKNLSIGLVGKNLNKPEFDTALGTVLAIDPQVRAGAALSFFNDKITLACDLDLTVNETYIEGYDSQFIGGGISFSPASFFSIRGGVMQNLQETEEGTIMTAGLGFGLKWIQLDIAGQYSSETGEYDGEEIPRYGKIMVSFVSKWK